jgi:hypothetical protein
MRVARIDVFELSRFGFLWEGSFGIPKTRTKKRGASAGLIGLAPRVSPAGTTVWRTALAPQSVVLPKIDKIRNLEQMAMARIYRMTAETKLSRIWRRRCIRL